MSNQTNSDNAKASENEASYNIFRDSLVRYLGYANEVGESFRYQFPKFVVPSYIVSFGYCSMDAANTGYETWQSNSSADNREMKTAIATFDTLLWQSLASVMIPGATINMIVRASRLAVARASLPVMAAKWLPTAMGLGSIPFIIHPIDKTVDLFLDNTTRPFLAEEKNISLDSLGSSILTTQLTQNGKPKQP